MLILPVIIVYTVVMIVPIVYATYISTFNWNIFTNLKTKVGFANYIEVLKSREFWHALGFTFAYSGSAVLMEFVLGYLIALFLNMPMHGTGIVRSILMLPMLIAPILVALTWSTMFNPSYGLLNYVLSLLHIDPSLWLSDTRTAFPSVLVVEVWKWTPYITLILFSGLQSIPLDYYEVAKIEGANRFQVFFRVTFPVMKPVAAVAIIFRTMGAFREFDLIYGLTKGGPGNATTNISMLAYRSSFDLGYISRGSAISVLMLIIIMIICILLSSKLLGDMWSNPKTKNLP